MLGRIARARVARACVPALLATGMGLAVIASVPRRPPLRARPSARELWGFTAPWDPRSAATVAQHGGALDVIVSGWLRLDTVTALPTAVYPDTMHVPGRPRRFALVTTYARDRFHPELIARLAADGALRGRTAGALARLASDSGYAGLVLDFEGLTPLDTTALATVVTAIADSSHRHGVRPVTIAVVPTDTIVFAERRLRAADLLLLMLYDEHWATGAPGPIASPAWVRAALAIRTARSGASRLVAALPSYGYLWKAPAPAAVLSFADAERLAADGGVRLTRDAASGMLHFVRPDSAQGWVGDAEQLRTLERTVDAAGVRRVAIWRLGLEDPRIWDRGGAGSR